MDNHIDGQMGRLMTIRRPQSGALIREMKISALLHVHDLIQYADFDLHASRNLKEP